MPKPVTKPMNVTVKSFNIRKMTRTAAEIPSAFRGGTANTFQTTLPNRSLAMRSSNDDPSGETKIANSTHNYK